MRSILYYLDYTINPPTFIFEDNAENIAGTNNQHTTKYLWHTNLRYFAILELVQNEDNILCPVPTLDSLSDKLIKYLGP